jgi:hypothetical protein
MTIAAAVLRIQSMSVLEKYFQALIERVESSDLTNQGKDKDGFFEPTRAMVLQRLNLIKDLHSKPNPHARGMVKTSWQYLVEHLPPEWLVLGTEEKAELKKILEP